MFRLLLIGAALAGAHGAPKQHYWWVPTSSCVLVGQRHGSSGGKPTAISGSCNSTGGIGWHNTPEKLNPSDFVNPNGTLPPYCADDGNVLPCLGASAKP